jgi:hypothetical protein
MNSIRSKVPVWFWVAAGFFLIWNIIGVISFITHTFISKESLAALSSDERALYTAYPLWITFIFAMAVIFGTIGAIGLLLKKKWSKPAFIISLAAIIPQMIYIVFFTKSIAVYGTMQAITMPILVSFFGIILIWFATMGIKKQWLS